MSRMTVTQNTYITPTQDVKLFVEAQSSNFKI